MDYSLIVTCALFFLAAVGIGFGMFKGYRQSWQKTLARIVTVLLATVTAILVAKGTAKSVVSSALEMVLANMPAETLDQISAALPSFEQIAGALVSIILAPIIYFIPLIIFRIIYSIIAHYVMKSLLGEDVDVDSEFLDDEEEYEEESDEQEATETENAEEEEEETETAAESTAPAADTSEKLLGMLLGAICGLMIFIVSWAPLTGAIGLLGEVSDSLKEQEVAELEEVYEIVDPIADSAAVKFTNSLGGKVVFNSLTRARANGMTIELRDEINAILVVVQNMDTFTGGEIKDEDIPDLIKVLSSVFDNSTVLPLVASEFISGAANAWSNGKDFMGMPFPAEFDNPEIEAILLSTIASFKDSNVDTIRRDVHTIANIAIIIFENDVMGIIESDNPMELLSNEKVVRALLLEILENPHTSSIVSNGIDLAVHMFASSALGAREDLNGLYNALVSELASISYTDDKTLAKDIKSAFSAVGIGLTKECSEELAKKFVDTFGAGLANISEDGVKTLLRNTALTISLSDKTTKTIYIKNNTSIIESTVLITIEALKTTHNPITDPDKEVDALVETIAALPDLADKMTADSSDITVFMEDIGGILDHISASSLIGRDCVNNLIILIFQSDMLTDVLPLDTVSITNAANTIIRSAANKSYKVVMSDLAKTVDALMAFADSSSEGITDTEKLGDLLVTITPESAEIIENMVNDELVSNLGVDEESASAVTDILSSTLNDIASIEDEEKKAEEAEKITNVINTTIEITTGNGEGADVNMTEYVGSILDSSVLTGTIVDQTYDENGELKENPLNTGYTYVPADDEEKKALEDTLTEKLTNSENPEETEKAIQAIGSIVNAQFIIVDGQVILVTSEIPQE